MLDNEDGGGLAFRSPVRAVVFWAIMAMLVAALWSEGVVSGWTAFGLLVAAALLGWWLVRTRPENDEMTARDVREFTYYNRPRD